MTNSGESRRTCMRMLGSAAGVVGFAVAIWAFVEWRSAAPPPPRVEIPGQ